MEKGQEGHQLRDPKCSLPDLDMEIHGKCPGAHQPFHEVPLPVGELGMDGCGDTAESWLYRLTTLPPTGGARETYFCVFRPAITSYKTRCTTWICHGASETGEDRKQAGKWVLFWSNLRQRVPLLPRALQEPRQGMFSSTHSVGAPGSCC